MKYDFDSTVDRTNTPYSYSAKWKDEGMLAQMVRAMMGVDALPDDRLCFQTADMDFKCAPELVEAMKKTAEHGIFGYSVTPDAYYEAVCRWFHDRFDWDFSPKSIVPTTDGTHDLICRCIESYTQPGEGVIVLLPSYNYHSDIESISRVQVGVQLINSHGYYTIDYDALEKACADPKNNLIILIQPHNPTGRIFTEEEILKIGEICRRNGVIIISDEVHIDIARQGNRVLPVMKVLGPQGVISATAVNKTFNVAGLGMSNLIIEDPYLMARFKKRLFLANPFGVSAVIAAYTKCDCWVDELNAYLDQLIDYTLGRFSRDLPKAEIVKPEGTYVLWIDFSNYGLSDEELAKKLNSTHVILVDGNFFDAEHAGQYRRICLTSPMSQVVEMCDRLAAAFNDC